MFCLFICLVYIKNFVTDMILYIKSTVNKHTIQYNLMKRGDFSSIVSGMTLPQYIVGIQYKTCIEWTIVT